MSKNFNWIEFHDNIKQKYLSLSKNLWWGDDLDVRFYLLKRIRNCKNKKMLDIGCNIGLSLTFLDKTNEVTGIDIDEYCVKKAKEINPDKTIIKASMDNLPFEDNSFDVITMMNVIPYHDFLIDNKEEMIRNTFKEVHRVLKDNGTLYLSTPNGDSIYYGNTKATFKELNSYLKSFSYDLKGWNCFPQITPSFFPRKFQHIPPKLVYKFNFVWEILERNLNKKVETSKYFYLEAKKVNKK